MSVSLSLSVCLSLSVTAFTTFLPILYPVLGIIYEAARLGPLFVCVRACVRVCARATSATSTFTQLLELCVKALNFSDMAFFFFFFFFEMAVLISSLIEVHIPLPF